jgi:hypothetical protein
VVLITAGKSVVGSSVKLTGFSTVRLGRSSSSTSASAMRAVAVGVKIVISASVLTSPPGPPCPSPSPFGETGSSESPVGVVSFGSPPGGGALSASGAVGVVDSGVAELSVSSVAATVGLCGAGSSRSSSPF